MQHVSRERFPAAGVTPVNVELGRITYRGSANSPSCLSNVSTFEAGGGYLDSLSTAQTVGETHRGNKQYNTILQSGQQQHPTGAGTALWQRNISTAVVLSASGLRASPLSFPPFYLVPTFIYRASLFPRDTTTLSPLLHMYLPGRPIAAVRSSSRLRSIAFRLGSTSPSDYIWLAGSLITGDRAAALSRPATKLVESNSPGCTCSRFSLCDTFFSLLSILASLSAAASCYSPLEDLSDCEKSRSHDFGKEESLMCLIRYIAIEIGPEILDFYRVSSNLETFSLKIQRSSDEKILSERLSDCRIFLNLSNVDSKDSCADVNSIQCNDVIRCVVSSVPCLFAMIQQSRVILVINEAWRNYFIIWCWLIGLRAVRYFVSFSSWVSVGFNPDRLRAGSA